MGHNLILFTMRSGKELDDAINWFLNNEIPLWSVNSNPRQYTWTKSPNVYADMYIDDAAFGCPLICSDYSDRPFVNWKIIDDWINKIGNKN